MKSSENLRWKSYRLSTSPVRCSHCTLENQKIYFQQYYSYIVLLIYVTSQKIHNPLVHATWKYHHTNWPHLKQSVCHFLPAASLASLAYTVLSQRGHLFTCTGCLHPDDISRDSPTDEQPTSAVTVTDQGGYIFYAGASIAGVSCRRRWPRLLLLPWQR